jgi:hypothetical protein
MKKENKSLLLGVIWFFLIILGLIYLAASFPELRFNPANWEYDVRKTATIATVADGIISLFAYLIARFL